MNMEYGCESTMNHGNMVGFHSNVLIVLRDEKYVFVNAEKNREKQVIQIRRMCKKMHKQLGYIKHGLWGSYQGVI